MSGGHGRSGCHRAALGLAWLSQSGSGPLLKLLKREGPEAIWGASFRRLLAWGVSPAAAALFQQQQRCFDATVAEAVLVAAGLWFLPYGSRHFPPELNHLRLPPPGLFVRGCEEVLERLLTVPRVTIVGTRKATAYGLQATEAFASAFADRGVVVVSGMALGVDGRAHRAALQAGGLTVAVLGCGADIAYPRSHRWMRDKIAQSGMVLSELPPGTTPARWTFPHRNRLLAALGDAVLVIEASRASGALQTAGWALELGRPVFSVPGPIYAQGHEGCNRLLYDGAGPAVDPRITVEDFLIQTRIERGERMVSELPRRTMPECWPRSTCKGASDDCGEGILGALASGPSTVDGLLAHTGLAVRRLNATLAQLELAGLVARAGPGVYIRAP